MKIAVLLGGTSAERDVSIASGLRVVEALRKRRHEVSPVDPAAGVIDDCEFDRLRATRMNAAPPTLEALAQLVDHGFSPSLVTLPQVRDADVVFLALHGGHGEDGTVQALLELCGLPYTGSGPMASAVAMDKDLSKTLFRAAGVSTADWIMAPPGDAPVDVGEAVRRLGLPIVVKPSKQGSTVGLTVVKTVDALMPAVALARQYDDEVMLERFVAGREFTVCVLGDEVLPIGEIIPAKEIYDYECKYTAGMAREVFPADLDHGVAAEMRRQSLAAFRALKLAGCARIDFRLGPDGELACLEANTLPGMTELSLVPQAAAAAGMDFPTLCDRIVGLAVERARREK